MKRLICILTLAIVFVSCKKDEAKDYVTLSGKIENPSSEALVISQNNIIKEMKVNTDGTFSDTLKVTPGKYILFDGTEQAYLYLKNGFDLKITLDTKAFDESISYSGIGEDANNYLAEKVLLRELLLDNHELMDANKVDFDKKVSSSIKELQDLLNNVPNLDATFIANEEKSFKAMAERLAVAFNKKNKAAGIFKGKASPKFNNYENYAGGSTSLDDLKGKYVYIDLWATWCGPCKAEIPSLKRIEKAYHDKNIVFVSISLDRANAYQTWRDMVDDKKMSGIQLYAKGDEKFARDYNVSAIPRFILIDPKGNVVDENAPRPSNKKLIELFEELNI
ncbi:TlpA disulfide reductase family protein [uncultured Algibacter sp.]|uniref:TlpA family protein disulfide reductase n=1 Tax=uncultured Algibacter sp. TaxID=298659 RepID=UPI0026181A1E|nr:TlpA disulfide reductase family protein [uncultured Algibacter sp.]